MEKLRPGEEKDLVLHLLEPDQLVSHHLLSPEHQN